MAVPTTREKRYANRGWLRGLVLGDRIQNLGSDGSFSGSITDASFSATNQDAITLANNQSDGKFAISVNTTGSDHTYTLKAPVTTQRKPFGTENSCLLSPGYLLQLLQPLLKFFGSHKGLVASSPISPQFLP